MKKILLAIILVVGFSGVANAQNITQNIICPEMYYFPKTIEDSTLALQEKCSVAATKYFRMRGYKDLEERNGQKEVYEFECHYNKKLDKCFILITVLDLQENGTYYESGWNLYDVFELKQYGQFFEFPSHGIKFSGEINNKSCKSRVECESLIKSYMEN